MSGAFSSFWTWKFCSNHYVGQGGCVCGEGVLPMYRNANLAENCSLSARMGTNQRKT